VLSRKSDFCSDFRPREPAQLRLDLEQGRIPQPGEGLTIKHDRLGFRLAQLDQADRDHDDVVLAVFAEESPFPFFEDAEDPVKCIIQHDRLADRIHAGESDVAILAPSTQTLARRCSSSRV